MKKKLLKIFSFLSFVFLLNLGIFATPAKADFIADCQAAYESGVIGIGALKECKCIFTDTFDAECVPPCDKEENKYTTNCYQQYLKTNDLDSRTVAVRRTPRNFLITIFNVLLGIVFAVVVFRIVMAGIGISGAKDDLDKRKEGFQKIISASLGLAIALSAYALTRIVLIPLGVKDPGEFQLNCDELKKSGASDRVYLRCREFNEGIK